MAEQPDRQLCGDVDELDYGIWFECELPPGHAGDHQTVHTWTNKPHGPMRPPRPNKWVSEAWAKTLGEAYTRTLLMRPVEGRSAVVNRGPKDSGTLRASLTGDLIGPNPYEAADRHHGCPEQGTS